VEFHEEIVMERWKEIKGYSDYFISNWGRVKSSYRKNRHIFLKYGRYTKGYMFVNLYRRDINNTSNKRACSISRLVAKHFIPNPKNLPEVNHKDGVKSHNYYRNLEWCTRSYNTKHAYKKGLRVSIISHGSNNGNSKLTDSEVIKIRRLCEIEHYGEMTQKEIAERFRITVHMVQNIKHKRNWKKVRVRLDSFRDFGYRRAA
jgi:hypothetical protein